MLGEKVWCTVGVSVFIPKVLSGVGVRALCRQLEFLYSNLGNPCLYGHYFVLFAGTRSGLGFLVPLYSIVADNHCYCLYTFVELLCIFSNKESLTI